VGSDYLNNIWLYFSLRKNILAFIGENVRI